MSGRKMVNIYDIKKECEKISPAVIFHLEKLLEREINYKTQHKKTINHIKEIIIKLKIIDNSIKYKISLLNEFKKIGIVQNKQLGGVEDLR